MPGGASLIPEDENVPKKKKAPKPPPKPKRFRQNSRDSGMLTPLNKRSHYDDFPRHYAKYPRSASIRSGVPDDPCYTCLRTSVHCYNIVILIIGLGVLGIGIWLLVTEYSAREITVLVGSNMFEIATYLMIAGGGTIALLAFCGCCGTMREDRCVLAFYAITLCLVLLALISGGVLAFIFRGTLSSTVQTRIKRTLIESYGVNLRKSSENRLITDAWDSMQSSLECCGVSGNVNSTDSWAIYKLHSQWYTQTDKRIPYVPESCCSGNKRVCQGSEQIHGAPTKGPPIGRQHQKNDFLYTDGCYDKVIVHVERNALILGGVAAFVPLTLIVGVVIVFCLCARVRKDDIEDFDL